MDNVSSTPSIPTIGSSSSSTSWTSIVVPAFVAYTLLCSLLRLRRRDSLQKKFSYLDRASLSRMTDNDAQAIVAVLAELEFPKLYLTSLQFALFKTYGIPTISSLLMATKELSTAENASKRYADTTVLIGEFTAHPPASERSIQAIARMNYIHSGYQKSGKITQDDLLYTLSVFITEPISWVSKFEWRQLTEMEICAISTQWKSIGDSMGIEYTKLAHYPTWKDGIEFYEDISSWAKNYEEACMVPAKSNHQTANETVALLLHLVPHAARGPGRKAISVLMGDRLRKAMIFEETPPSYHRVVHGIFGLRKFILRHLSLPRPSFLRVHEFSDSPDAKTGRYFYNQYQAHPYYNKPGFLNRWGLEAWMVWIAGGDIPGDKGDLYCPQGYLFPEVGPKGLRNKGQDFTDESERNIKTTRTGGCPFA